MAKTLEQNINQAISDFASIKDKIVEKGVDVPAGTPTRDYAAKVDGVYDAGAQEICDVVNPVVITETNKLNNRDAGSAYESAKEAGKEEYLESVLDPNKKCWAYFGVHYPELVDKLTYEMTSNGTNYSGSFFASELTIPPAINTSKCPVFNYMFYDCKNLEDISNLDFSNGQQFSCMCSKCTNLKDISNLNLSNGWMFPQTFMYCQSLDNIESLDLSKAMTAFGMFGYCTGLKKVNINSLGGGVSYNLEASRMFQECTSLEDIALQCNNTLVNGYYLFYKCSALKNVNITNARFINTNFMFYSCSNLIHGPELNLTHINGCRQMYDNCSQLIDASIDAPNSTSFLGTFYNCKVLESVSLGDMSGAQTCDSIFYNCNSLVNLPEELNTINCTSFRNFFNHCYVLLKIPKMNTDKGINFKYTFKDCYLITEIPEINTSMGTEFEQMFYDDRALVTIPKLNLTNATEVTGTFDLCASLENLTLEGTLGINGFDVSGSPLLTHDSLMSIINALVDYSTDASGTTWVCTLGETNLVKLTEAEIAIATRKGWMLV